jgi:dihydroneopterin aldolase
MTGDVIFIHSLEVETIIGVYERERNIKQTVLIDLELTLAAQPEAGSDELRSTVDYDAVSIRVTSLIESTQYQLIETLAEKIAEVVLNEFAVESLKLKLSKPGAVKNANNVGIIINRPQR